MTLKGHLPLLAIFALSNSAFAQHHQAPHVGVHPGAGAMHPGQAHPNQQMQPHHMTPDMQMWNDYMLFDQIMRSRRAPSRPQGGQSPNGNVQRPSANAQNRTAAATHANGLNSVQPKANPAHKDAKQLGAKKAESQTLSKHSSKEEHEKEARAKAADAKKEGHHLEKSLHQIEARKGVAVTRRPLAGDQSAISLLRTAQSKLSRADHDYGGHRVNAMRHVAHALEHLTGSYLFNENAGYGLGNLPQTESDRLLREAEGHLNFIETSLRTRTNSLEHHQSARTSVAEAIHELRTALAIR